MPFSAEVDLKQRAEIHRQWRFWDPNVTEVSGAVARGYIHATAKRNGQMSVVATNAYPLLMGTPSGAIRTSMGIAELDSLVAVLQYRLNTSPAFRKTTEQGPRQAAQLLRIAIATAEQENQDVMR